MRPLADVARQRDEFAAALQAIRESHLAGEFVFCNEASRQRFNQILADPAACLMERDTGNGSGNLT
jgi:hypothetical protein